MFICYSVFFTEKIPSDATFFGAQYFTYNLSGQGDGLVSNRDSISLDFRTKHPDGLLFYTGKEPTFSCVCASVSVNSCMLVLWYARVSWCF